MLTVTLRGAKAIIFMAVAKRKSVLLMGTPGIGKTEICEQVGKEMNIGFLCFEAPSLDPTDVRGVLMPNGKASFFTRSALLPDREIHGDKGILLIDELTSGMPAVQVSLHPLFHPRERRLGNDKLPDGWIPMATGNYASDGAGAQSLLTALSDRVCIVNVVEDYTVWKQDYAIPREIHPLVTGFLDFRTDLFSTFAKRKKGENGKTFGSPRTHTSVSDVFYYDEEVGQWDESELQACIAGYVGEGISSEYMAFKQIYGKLMAEKIVDKILQGEDILFTEPSMIYAICSAIRHRVKIVQMPLADAIDRALLYSTKLDAEFGALLIRDLFVQYQATIIKSKHWVKISQRY